MDSEATSRAPDGIPHSMLNSRGLCDVCGALAIGRNFAAMTCLSCKAFFRRNAYNESLRRTCRVQGTCDITPTTRRYCAGCRLNKCFRKGMRKELIRSQRSTNPTQTVEVSTVSKNQSHSTLSAHSPRSNTFDLLLYSDRFSLSFDNWNLLTNVNNAYENQCAQYFLAFHETIPIIPSAQPIRSRIKPQRFIDLTCKYVWPVASFLRRILALDTFITSAEDRRRQIKNTAQYLTIINTAELMQSKASQNLPWEYDRLLFESILTEPLLQRLSESLNGFRTLRPYDSLMMKLSLIVFALSTRIAPVFNQKQYDSSDFIPISMDIFSSQNFYVTLLWKYMVYRMGEDVAIHVFVVFVQQFIHGQIIEANIQETLNNRDDQGQLAQLMQSSLGL